MCTNSSAPDFFFDAPGKPYASQDIYPGTAGALDANQAYTSTVTVHNSGMQSAPATVQLWVCPPGTNVIAGTADRLAEANTSTDVPACTGANDGTRSGAHSVQSWNVNWTPGSIPSLTISPGNTVHMCLFARVKYDGSVLGTTATSYPSDADPMTPQNAQHNIDVLNAAYPFKKKFSKERFFGFGIVNATARELKGQITSYLVKAGDDRFAWLLRNPRLAKLLERGRLRELTSAGMVLGKERIVVSRDFGDDAPQKPPQKGERRQRPCRTLGNTGILERETYLLLAEGKENKKRPVTLIPGEVRQGMVHLVPPNDAKPGDLFAVDIRHEVVVSGRTKTPKVIGGLVVILQIVGEPAQGKKAY